MRDFESFLKHIGVRAQPWQQEILKEIANRSPNTLLSITWGPRYSTSFYERVIPAIPDAQSDAQNPALFHPTNQTDKP